MAQFGVQDSLSVHVPLESLDQVFECVPDARALLLRALNSDKNYVYTQVEVLRGLFFSGDKQEPPQWSSAEAREMLKNPPLLLAERFPSADSIIDESTASLMK